MIRSLLAHLRWMLVHLHWLWLTATVPAWLDWLLHWTGLRRMSPGRCLYLQAARWVKHGLPPEQPKSRGPSSWYHNSDLPAWFLRRLLPDRTHGEQYEDERLRRIGDPWAGPFPLFRFSGILVRVSLAPSRDTALCTLVTIHDGAVHASLVRTPSDVIFALDAVIQGLPAEIRTDPDITPPTPPWQVATPSGSASVREIVNPNTMGRRPR